MKGTQPRLELAQTCAGRLDEQLTFRLALDRSFPAVRRRHRRVDVDARCQTLVDESARELIRAILADRRHHDHHIAHDHLLYFRASCCTVSHAWPKTRASLL